MWTTVCWLNRRSVLHTFCSIERVTMPSWASSCCQRRGQTERQTEVMKAKHVSLMSARFQRAVVVEGDRGFSAAFREWILCVCARAHMHIQIPRLRPGSQIRKGQFCLCHHPHHHMVLTWNNPQRAEQGGDVSRKHTCSTIGGDISRPAELVLVAPL